MLGNFKHDLRALEAFDQKRDSYYSSIVVTTDRESAAARNVRDAVYAAWARLLGAEAVDEDKTWESAGGDLLKALELIFELEVALRRRISMRFLGPATRPSQLIVRLQSRELGDGKNKGTTWRRPIYVPFCS